MSPFLTWHDQWVERSRFVQFALRRGKTKVLVVLCTLCAEMCSIDDPAEGTFYSACLNFINACQCEE